jgi:class 3 adenylate cyclase
MDNDKLEELPQTRDQADQALEKLKTPMTILFSDIKGSTAYAEKNGDIEYMKMIGRHNGLLFPIIEDQGGRVVKTIGDAILAQFDDPVHAIKASAEMQRALARHREDSEESDHIRIRVGLHYGFGLIKDNDVFGDVVNVASRVENQADAEQVLITEALLDAAETAGFEYAKMERAEIKGKDEPIDLYALAWSETATKQLIREVEIRYKKLLKDLKKEHDQLEEEYEEARDQWRAERRNLNDEIDGIEDAVEKAKRAVREQLTEDLQSELRFQLDQAVRSREQMEQALASAREQFEADRTNLKAQIASMQDSVLEAMERSNNPARATMAVREQVEARVAEARQDWQLQWDGERKRLVAEIERLKKAPGALDGKKEAARRAVLQKLGKLPADGEGSRPADPPEQELADAKIGWDTEREQLNLKIKNLESTILRSEDTMRSEIFIEARAQYEPVLAEAERRKQQLEIEIQSLSGELSAERQRLSARITQLEAAIPQAQEAARKQTLAETKSQYEEKIEEATRARARLERKQQDAVEESEAENRQQKKRIAALEEQLKEAREAPYKAQKSRVTS